MCSKKMGFSAALCCNLPSTSRARRSSHHCHLTVEQKQRFLVFPEAQKRKNRGPLVIGSVLNKLKSDINGNNGAYEPAKFLLERLFAKAQTLEEIISKDSSPADDEFSMNLAVLESDLQVALSVIRKKEEDLQHAERRVLLENARSNRTMQDLEHLEREISCACATQKQMEEDIKKANCDLASRSMHIEDLKLLVEEQGNKIASSQFALSLKEDEMDKLRNELMGKHEEAAIMNSELKSREQLLDYATEINREQGAEVEELATEVGKKERDLLKALQQREVEEERLNIMEAYLENQTVEWLAAREELKELKEQASKRMNDAKETFEGFKRVRALLSHVRSELISTQESLASSRRTMEDQALQFEKQLAELNEQKLVVIPSRERLEDAQLEVKNEKIKLRAAYARLEELELQMSAERESVEHLQEEVKRERSILEQEKQEIVLLQKELQQKELEDSDAQNFLQVKEYELVEAKLQIQHMKSEQASVQLILQEIDADLLNAQRELTDVNHDIAELQRLLNSKDDHLSQFTTRLRQKKEQEFDDPEHRFSEATSILHRIAQLTNKLLVSVKDEESSVLLGLLDEGGFVCDMEHNAGPRKQKQLETELEMVKGSLREKEMDFLAAQRALIVKDEELGAVHRRLDTREKEVEKLKDELWEDANGVEKLPAVARDRITGDLVIEKLQLEVAQSEADAATSALQRLAEMTCQLLNTTVGSGTGALTPPMGDGSGVRLDRIEGVEVAEKEVARLFTLTELLVKEADIENTKL